MHQGIFPDNAKIASFALTDKGKRHKYDVLNCRSIGILRASSKIQEKITKNQLMFYLNNNNHSPFLSAYWKRYSTQQVCIHLLEERREILHNNFIVRAFYVHSLRLDYC